MLSIWVCVVVVLVPVHKPPDPLIDFFFDVGFTSILCYQASQNGQSNGKDDESKDTTGIGFPDSLLLDNFKFWESLAREAFLEAWNLLDVLWWKDPIAWDLLLILLLTQPILILYLLAKQIIVNSLWSNYLLLLLLILLQYCLLLLLLLLLHLQLLKLLLLLNLNLLLSLEFLHIRNVIWS